MSLTSGAEIPLSLHLRERSLDRNKKFQLNRESHSNIGYIVITAFDTKRSITLICDNLDGRRERLNILAALGSGFIELVEAGKDDAIAIPSIRPQQLNGMKIPPEYSPHRYQVEAGLETDTTSERWKELLRPGHSYDLRLSKSKGEAWCYYTDEYDGPLKDIPSSQKLAVRREDGITRFTVYDDPPPPKLFAKLEMPQECYLSGHPPFKFVIEYSADSDKPITIDKSRSPLSVETLFDLYSLEQLIDCEDTETGEHVKWPAVFGCWDSDPHPSFPKDADFVEILPNKPWRFEYELTKEPDFCGSLADLESGKTYKAQIAEDAPGGFSRWQFGRKKDLLSGSLEEKKRRWAEIEDEDLGYLTVDSQNEPVVFKALE